MTMPKVERSKGERDVEATEPRVVLKPDGYYWVATDGRHPVGPFATAEAARLDALSGDESDIEPAETLLEAEDEIGQSDWIDPETGGPAEEQRPRTEEH